MDTFTASLGLVFVQICIAAVMLGAHSAARHETCTRNWALASLMVASGVLILVLNAGAFHLLPLIIGNNLVVLGLVVMWWGLQAFFKRKISRAGWYLAGAFFLAYAGLLAARADIGARALLASVTIATLLVLCARELWLGWSTSPKAGRMIAMAGLMLSLGCYAARIVGGLMQSPHFMVNNLSSIGVGALYVGPMCASLLLFSGLLLLHYEGIIRQTDHLATHDALTGLLNRRAIDASGRREVEMAVRLKHSLCVAVVDIDFFKRVNDELGHQAGDSVIQEMGAVLQKLCRNIDLVGRYGGEEFCIIFPMLAPDGASVVAKRIVEGVRQHPFASGRSLTASVGVVAWSQVSDEISWEKLVGRADAELYKAKHAGRNQFSMRIADGESETGAVAA
jgi:diguanylate cyclase (GGDEF)-like protein